MLYNYYTTSEKLRTIFIFHALTYKFNRILVEKSNGLSTEMSRLRKRRIIKKYKGETIDKDIIYKVVKLILREFEFKGEFKNQHENKHIN